MKYQPTIVITYICINQHSKNLYIYIKKPSKHIYLSMYFHPKICVYIYIYLQFTSEFYLFKPGTLFNEAMASHSKQFVRDLVANYPHIFDGLNSLVDVGGGTGTAVKTIAAAFPSLRCTVFDLPHVTANASKNDSFDVVGGDMFEKIPPADAILLKVIYFSLKSKLAMFIIVHELQI
jgi:O-methyltransferase domain